MAWMRAPENPLAENSASAALRIRSRVPCASRRATGLAVVIREVYIRLHSSLARAAVKVWGKGRSEVPGKGCPIRGALLEECVAALGGLIGHVCQARGFPGEDLLADQPVVHQVERELEHALGRRAL